MADNPRDLLALEEDWDSYGADPITEEAVKTAETIHYTPSNDGGICVEMYGGGVEIGIEILPNGKVDSIFTQIKNNETV